MFVLQHYKHFMNNFFLYKNSTDLYAGEQIRGSNQQDC